MIGVEATSAEFVPWNSFHSIIRSVSTLVATAGKKAQSLNVTWKRQWFSRSNQNLTLFLWLVLQEQILESGRDVHPIGPSQNLRITTFCIFQSERGWILNSWFILCPNRLDINGFLQNGRRTRTIKIRCMRIYVVFFRIVLVFLKPNW